VDGRLVLLGFIVVVAGVTTRNLEPVRSAGAAAAERAQERAVDAVLVGVNQAQLCYLRRRDTYADTMPSLAFSGGHYMQTAIQHRIDITLHTSDGGRSYEEHVRGADVDAVVARRGREVVRLDVGGRPPPRLAARC
jgi:hypothetical protein